MSLLSRVLHLSRSDLEARSEVSGCIRAFWIGHKVSEEQIKRTRRAYSRLEGHLYATFSLVSYGCGDTRPMSLLH